MFVLIIALVFTCTRMVSAESCYKLNANYTADNNFFSYFNFETFDDPTHGFVDYVNEFDAKSLGLTSYIDGKVYIGVDANTVIENNARGRKSIRLTSKQVINGNNLVVIDLEHMPSTSGSSGLPQGCSVWPAFWTFGDDWPNKGEIDIIEYVNTDSSIQTTLHTNEGCDQSSEDTSLFSGTWGLTYDDQPSDNCDVNAEGQYTNAGCGIVGPSNAVGSSFNSNGVKGGVFVMQWSVDKYIQAFYFPRNNIPSDITAGKPQPENWGKPYARFELDPSSCPSSHFTNHNIIFDTTFCGDWAGSTFANACGTSMSCTDFVRYNPKEFVEAFWLINSLSIYDQC